MTRLLHEFFDGQWEKWPNRVAIDIPPGTGRPERTQTTYAQLSARADEIAAELRPLTAPDDIVALRLPRTTIDAFAAQLAVLRCGAAYTAIDPSMPAERVRMLLEDADPVAILERAPDLTLRRAQGHPEPSRGVKVQGSSLAYVIYTSGTTGRPKGVMVEHGAIANLVASDLVEFRLTGNDRVVQGSSHAYDSSIEEIWLAFSAGATLVVADDETMRAGPDLARWLEREHATAFCPPPTLLRTLGGHDAATRLPGLKLLYVGGEPLPRDVAEIWSANRRLVNGYGPTECAVTCLRADVIPSAPISVGLPIPGCRAWVIDETLSEVETEARGELCIGGASLARGYWRAPDLTSEKFVDHPTLGRIYRTGDLVHRDATGTFFFHGRIDSQVKVRGHRIELEEIESQLAQCDGIREAACRVQEARARQTLVAFLVASDPIRPPVADIRQSLLRSLPAHMVPQVYQFVSALPTTTGGKLDRSSLPTIRDAPDDTPRAAPASRLEALIESSARHVLGHGDPVPVDADFFADLHADSLRSAELVTALRAHPETAGLTVRDVYEAPSIAALARRAVPLSPRAEASRHPIARQRPLLITLAQTAWLLLELVAGSAAALWLLFIVIPWLVAAVGVVPFILLAPVLLAVATAAYTAAILVLAVAVKRLLIGR